MSAASIPVTPPAAGSSFGITPLSGKRNDAKAASLRPLAPDDDSEITYLHSEQFSTILPPSLRQSDSSVSFLQKPPIQQHLLPDDVRSMLSLVQSRRLTLTYKQAARPVNLERKRMPDQGGNDAARSVDSRRIDLEVRQEGETSLYPWISAEPS